MSSPLLFDFIESIAEESPVYDGSSEIATFWATKELVSRVKRIVIRIIDFMVIVGLFTINKYIDFFFS